MADAVIALCAQPDALAWLRVAFAIEGGPELDWPAFRAAARAQVAAKGSVQAVLDATTSPGEGDRQRIVAYVRKGLAGRLKVDCLTTGLAAYLLCRATDVQCTLYASETHTWVQTAAGDRIDARENLKHAERHPGRESSIYAGSKAMGPFSMCTLIVCNPSKLGDADVHRVLRHYADRLEFSWEVSTLFAGEHDQRGALGLLAKDDRSIALALQLCRFNIHNGDPDEALLSMHALLDRIDRHLCRTYIVDESVWLDRDEGVLRVAVDFVAGFGARAESLADPFATWRGHAVTLAHRCVGEDVAERFKRACPVLGGGRKRRRTSAKK